MNHNQFLGVSNGATEREIQRAFRKAALEIHPDHSNAPEAAEAFARIKEARDKLIEQVKQTEGARDAVRIQAATVAAVKATTNAAYSTSVYQLTTDDAMTPEELAHIQGLDRLAMEHIGKPRFRKKGESTAVRRHRRKIETVNRRLDGKY